MAHPILDSEVYRRDIAEARELQRVLAMQFFDDQDIRTVLTTATISHADVTLTGPSSTIWAGILDFAAKEGKLADLLMGVEKNLNPRPRNQSVWDAIDGVRQVTEATGSLAPMRLLLKGDRPFLGRTTLRGMLTALRDWDSAASILVVRGEPDSGRTETQLLINEGRDDAREKLVLLDQNINFESGLRAIWKKAGADGEPPALAQETLTTESAKLMDFWIDVNSALEDKNRRLWVLFDDLDKGPGRVAARVLAEVLAIRLADVSFQQRIRLVLLGYPDDQLPSKVTAGLVRNDETDKVATIDATHVRDFIDFCTKVAGKKVADPDAAAADIHTKAKNKTSATVPYLQALNGALCDWYKDL